MARTLHKLNEDEMQELAEKLIGMKWVRAKRHTRNLDPQAHLETLRVGFGDEIQTRYVLPNLGVRVTLVEKEHSEVMGSTQFHKLKAEPRFVEARVEPLAVS